VTKSVQKRKQKNWTITMVSMTWHQLYLWN